jgi:hypothetical protein
MIAVNAGDIFIRRIRSHMVMDKLLDMKDRPDSHTWDSATVNEAISLQVSNELDHIWVGWSA